MKPSLQQVHMEHLTGNLTGLPAAGSGRGALRRAELEAKPGQIEPGGLLDLPSGPKPPGPVAEMRLLLSRARELSGAREMEDLIGELITRSRSDGAARRVLEDWLIQQARSGEWMVASVPALAAMLEAAVLLQMAEAVPLLCAVLEYANAERRTAVVAAQRLRLLPSPDEAMRAQLFVALKKRIEVWESAPETEVDAVLALPSVPYVLPEEQVPWLCCRLQSGSAPVARALALGILDWRTGAVRRPPPQISDGTVAALAEAALTRLEAERERGALDSKSQDAVETLVWVLGALVTTGLEMRIATVLVRAFLRPAGLERAASLQGGSLFLRSTGDRGRAALCEAFGEQSDHCRRYLNLLSRSINGPP